MSTSKAAASATAAVTAYIVSATENWTIEPASARREWMDETPGRGAYRCLPLAMANQAGWVIGGPLDFSATWNGGPGLDDTKLEFPRGEGVNRGQVRSHFGSGVVTFSLPWLFRTPAGVCLLVRGPTNGVKDGIAPLDGVVETDWAPYTFTMNWKLTRPGQRVEFRRGEAVCMVMPMRLEPLVDAVPQVARLESDPVLRADYEAFVRSRSAALKHREATKEDVWEKNYMRGHLPDGTEVSEHRTNLSLRGFAR